MLSQHSLHTRRAQQLVSEFGLPVRVLWSFKIVTLPISVCENRSSRAMLTTFASTNRPPSLRDWRVVCRYASPRSLTRHSNVDGIRTNLNRIRRDDALQGIPLRHLGTPSSRPHRTRGCAARRPASRVVQTFSAGVRWHRRTGRHICSGGKRSRTRTAHRRGPSGRQLNTILNTNRGPLILPTPARIEIFRPSLSPKSGAGNC